MLRDVGRDESVRVDEREAKAVGGSGPAKFQDASSDGSRVFFTGGTHLTVGATKSSSEDPDLYMCEVSEGTGGLACHVKDLTVDAFAGEVADVQGAVIGASEDGSYVYFVADGILETSPGSSKPVAGAVHGDCSSGTIGSLEGLCNLYVRDGGVTRLVAVLSGEDLPGWRDRRAVEVRWVG